MLKHIVIFATLLVVLVGVASAELIQNTLGGTPQGTTSIPPADLSSSSSTPAANAVQAQIDQANRYLSAEVAQQIKKAVDNAEVNIKANNDDNFRLMDGRMTTYIDHVKQTVILGGIGAVLVAQALIGIILMRMWRRYSYEYYQEQIIKKQQVEIEVKDTEMNALKELQQQSWQWQQSQETLGMKMGQTEAMNMSQMNQWQMQPAYAGSWAPQPEATQQPYNPYPREPYAEQQPTQQNPQQTQQAQQQWGQGGWNQ